jgi:hypothetical protein
VIDLVPGGDVPLIPAGTQTDQVEQPDQQVPAATGGDTPTPPQEPQPIAPTQPPQPQEPTPAEAVAAGIKRRLQLADQVMMQTFEVAAKADPELARRAGQIASELGIDPLLAERNIDVVRENQRRVAIQNAMLSADPILRRQLEDPIFARKATDDFDNLSWYMRAAYGYQTGRLQVERGRVATSMLFGGEGLEDQTPNVKRLVEIDNQLKQLPPSEGIIANTWEVGAQMQDALAAGLAAAGVATAATWETGPGMGLTVPGAFAFGSLSVGLTQGLMMETGNQYADLLEKGVPKLDAASFGLAVGIVNTALEYVGAEFLAEPIRKTIGKELFARVLDEAASPTIGKAAARAAWGYVKGVAGEVGTEVLQEVSQIISEGAATGEWDGIGDRLAQIAIKTAQGVSLIGIPGSAMHANYEMGRVAWARRAGEFARRKAQAVAMSKIGLENPAALEEFANNADAATDLVNVYLDASQVEEMLKQGGKPTEGHAEGEQRGSLFESLDRVIPGMSDEVRRQAAQAGDIVMPSGTFQTKLSGFADGAFMPLARWGDKDALSEHDADRTEEILNKMGEPAIEQQAEDLTVNRRQLRAIEDHLTAQLQATGLMPYRRAEDARAQASLWPAFIEANRVQLGMTPEQFQAAFPLTALHGTTASGDAVLTQSRASTQIGQVIDRYDENDQAIHNVANVVDAVRGVEGAPESVTKAIEAFDAAPVENRVAAEEQVMRALRDAAGQDQTFHQTAHEDTPQADQRALQAAKDGMAKLSSTEPVMAGWLNPHVQALIQGNLEGADALLDTADRHKLPWLREVVEHFRQKWTTPAPAVDTATREQDTTGANVQPAQRDTATASTAPVETARGKRGRAAPRSRSRWGVRDDVAGVYATRTTLVETQRREIGAGNVTNAAEAAAALAHLRRGAVERVDGLVTDRNGKPLAIVGGFKGAVSEAPLYLPTLIGEAFRVKGAANIWLAHNHPSGKETLSGADRSMNTRAAEAFRGSGITWRGFMALGGGLGDGVRWEMADAQDTLSSGWTDLKQDAPTKTVPVVERVLLEHGQLEQVKITGPDGALAMAKKVAGEDSGIMLLDTQMRPVAFVPVTQEQVNELRVAGRMDALYRALSVANASGAFIVASGTDATGLTRSAILNLGGFLSSVGVQPYDVVFTSGTVRDSWSVLGRTASATPTFNQQVSTRLPGGEKATEDPRTNVLSTDLSVMMKDKTAVAKNASALRELPFLRVPEGATDEQVIETYVKHVADNLEWLVNQMSPEDRARSRLWYDGGRRVVEHWSQRYGISTMQAAAVIAVLSPQRNWFVNLSMAERILDAVTAMRDYKWDAAMTERANRRFGRIKAPKEWEGRTKQLRAAVEGKSLGEVLNDPIVAAYWIRVFDQAHNRADLSQWTPEGGTFGKDPTRMQWSSFPTIAKAVSILNDGSVANVYQQLGAEHKVRSFYDNLFAPNSRRGHITLDTHAVAAGYLLPVSSSDDLVTQVWGGKGGTTSRATGLLGFYPIMAEAYARVGRQYGLLPREVQSITWEQVRRMFEPAEKRTGAQTQKRLEQIYNKLDIGEITEEEAQAQADKALQGDLPAKANQIWGRYTAGDITQQQAREEIAKAFGGFGELPWKKQSPKTPEGDSYAGLGRSQMKQETNRFASPAARVMVEAKPNTNPELMKRWELLTPEDRSAATQDVLSRVVPMVLRQHGVEGMLVPQRGAWLGTPEASISVLLNDASKAVAVADSLGAALHQEGMFVMSLQAGPGLEAGAAVRIDLPEGFTTQEIDDLYTKVLWPITGLEGKHAAVGHSTYGNTMLIGVDPKMAGMTAQQLADAIEPLLEERFAVGVVDLHSAFRSRGEHYASTKASEESPVAAGSPAQPRSADHVGPSSTDIAAEAARAYAGALDEAEQRQRAAAAERDALIRDAQQFFGQTEDEIIRGAFDPRTMRVILNKDANFSTFSHELAHAFLTIYERLWEQKAHPKFVDDFNTFLSWAGETPESWKTKTLAEKRKAHEMFAESWEAHLFEGRAPEPGLARLFARLSAFLRRVYSRLMLSTAAKRLTPEIRAVMDRMVASEQAVQAAQATRGAVPAFLTQEESGMDNAAWAEHQRLHQEADEAAVAKMDASSLRVMKWLGRELAKADVAGRREAKAVREKMRPEVEQEVRKEPVHRAMRWLQTGEVEADGQVHKAEGVHKLSRDEVASILAPGVVEQDLLGTELLPDESTKSLATLPPEKQMAALRKFLAADGLPVDTVAGMFGFPTSRDLLQAMLTAKPIDTAVDEALDARMLQEHPELADPRQRRAAAEDALHNEARQRFVAAELRALDKSMEPVRVTMAVAKEAARRALEGRAVGDLSASGMLEGVKRASLAAQKAVQKGDRVAAIQWKRRQLMLEQMASQAEKVRKEVGVGVRLLRSFDGTDAAIAKTRDIDLAYAAQALAAAYQLHPGFESEQRVALANKALERVATEHPVEWERLKPLLARAKPAHLASTPTIATGKLLDWRHLTVAEFRELRQVGEQLWDAAADERQLSSEASKIATRQALGELASQLASAPARSNTARPPADHTPGLLKTVVLEGWGVLSSLKIWEHAARYIDGGKAGGAFQRYLVLPMNRALERYRAAKAPLVARLAETIREAQQRHGAAWHTRIDVPDLRGNGQKFTFNGVREILGAMLNAGTLSNLEANLVGRGWGEMVEGKDGTKQLDTSRWDAAVRWFYAEKILTEADNKFLTDWWGTFEGLLPLAQATHKLRFGYEFKTIEKRAVQTPFGVLEGGYTPKRADRRLAPKKFLQRYSSADAEFTSTADDFQYSVGTKKGFTLNRSDSYRPPLQLDVGSMVSNVDEELRFIHLEPVLNDMHKILRGRLETEGGGSVRFEDLLNEYDRELLTRVIVPTMQNAALQRTSLPTQWPVLDSAVRVMRSAASLAYLGFNLANSMLQAGGVSNARNYVAGKHLRAASREVLWSPHITTTFITDRSPAMQQRWDDQVMRLQQEISRASKGPVAATISGARQAMARWAFFPQRVFQMFADKATWLGSYHESQDANLSEAESVERADQAVRLAQGAANAESMAPFSITHPFVSLWTQFGNYSNLVLNQIMGSQSRASAFGWALLLPAVLEYAVKTLFRGGIDDRDHDDSKIDDLAMGFGGNLARNAVGLVPFAGPLLLALAQSDGTRVLEAPGATMARDFYRGLLEIGKAAMGDQTTNADWRVIAAWFTMVTGVPLAGPARLVLR